MNDAIKAKLDRMDTEAREWMAAQRMADDLVTAGKLEISYPAPAKIGDTITVQRPERYVKDRYYRLLSPEALPEVEVVSFDVQYEPPKQPPAYVPEPIPDVVVKIVPK